MLCAACRVCWLAAMTLSPWSKAAYATSTDMSTGAYSPHGCSGGANVSPHGFVQNPENRIQQAREHGPVVMQVAPGIFNAWRACQHSTFQCTSCRLACAGDSIHSVADAVPPCLLRRWGLQQKDTHKYAFFADFTAVYCAAWRRQRRMSSAPLYRYGHSS